VLKDADAALYQAKAGGRGIACFYNHEVAPVLRTGEAWPAS
jgi:predicted signal transduction protein with EAL and GGDEF domain